MPNLKLIITFKSDLCAEYYVNLPPYKRSVLASLRSGSMKLDVETDRLGIPAHRRYCTFCVDSPEDEKHFLLEYPVNNDIHSDLTNYFL